MARLVKLVGKIKVIFVCFHNSARSQMAEGLLRAIYEDRYEVYSAGIEASQVDPRAVKVMSEIGIDISGQHSKKINEYRSTLFDVVVTVCDRAKDMCPICGINLKGPLIVPASNKTIHKTFKDPATTEGSEEDRLIIFRQVREEIKDWIIQTFKSEI